MITQKRLTFRERLAYTNERDWRVDITRPTASLPASAVAGTIWPINSSIQNIKFVSFFITRDILQASEIPHR